MITAGVNSERTRAAKPKANVRLNAAVEFAGRGFKVFPLHTATKKRDSWVCSCGKLDCASPAKHPRTQHGLKDASDDEATIHKWWRRWTNANLGIATGRASGLWVLDIDGKQGEKSLQRLLDQHGALPNTWEVATGRGRHIYFAMPEDGSDIRNTAAQLAVGIDTRGTGGYSTAPPSRHISGVRYRFRTDHDPASAPLANAPAWLISLIKSKKRGNGHDPGAGGGDIPEGQRNAVLASLAGSMLRSGMTPKAIEVALLKENDERCDPPLDKAEVRGIARSVSAYKPAEPDARPIIQVVGGELPRMVDEAEAALLAGSENEVFERAGHLVIVARTRAKEQVGGVTRDGGALTIRALTSARLVDLLTRCAQFQKFDARTNRARCVDCPTVVAQTLLERVGQWRVPVLEGIIEAPTMRADGSIHQKQGYDEQTGVWLDTGGVDFPRIPDRPSRDDALEALEAVKQPFEGFPYVSKADKSVAIAATITGVVRRALPSAPCFGFDAPLSSSGKSLQAEAVAIIAIGRVAPSMSQGASDEEDGKRLLAVLMAGDPVILIDNVERPIRGDCLSSILTQSVYRGRILGKSEMILVPTNVLIMATGNNLTFAGDMTTRAIICSIDPKMERPEEREFDVDLRGYVLANRPHLVQSALIILRAYHVAGRPKQDLRQFGRFEQWSDLVRSALVWLGETDPVVTRERIEASDPVRRGLEAVLVTWSALFGDRAFTLNTALAKITCLRDNDEDANALYVALADVAGNNSGVPTARHAAAWLRKVEGRIVGGLKFERAGNDGHNAIKWCVTGVTPRGEDSQSEFLVSPSQIPAKSRKKGRNKKKTFLRRRGGNKLGKTRKSDREEGP